MGIGRGAGSAALRRRVRFERQSWWGMDSDSPALVFIFLGMVGMGLASVRLQEKGAAKSQ